VVREDPKAEAIAEVQSKPKPKTTPVKHNLLRSLRDTDPGTLPGTISTSEGPVQAYVAPQGTRPRAVSLDIPRGYGQRAGSSSPSRNVHAHFVEGSSLVTPMSIRHQPPPRSVSPMKSALRQSPASSVRNISPNVAVNSKPRAPPSETSDTTSLASQDGIKPAKVKKSVRISEDGSDPVPPAGDPNARRELSGSWANDDTSEMMKPRSALPSFSSVRGRKLEQAEKPEKVTETVSSSMTNSASTLPDHREASNDQLVGAVLAQHYAQKERKFDTPTSTTNEPLPPQVTSKETSADLSDSAYSEDEAETYFHPPAHAEKIITQDKGVASSHEPATLDHSVEAPEANPIENVVPSLALQPPTPGVEEESEPPLDAAAAQPASRPVLKQRNSMPGSWDGEDWDQHKPAALSRQAVRDEALLSENDSSDDEAAVLQPAQTSVEGVSPVLHPIYESDSDVSEDFADAEEDFEPGGFASLDAIVESPVTRPAAVIPSPPISPQAALPPSRANMSDSSALSDEQDNTDWNSATAYWSSLSRKKRLELEAEAEAAIAVPVVESAPKPKKKKQPIDQLDITNPTTFAPAALSSRDDPFEAEEQQESRAPTMRKSMRDSGESERTSSESQMRKSMRGPPAPVASSNETHMRTSMRAGGSTRPEGTMKTSMRGDAGAKPSKRTSAPVTTSIPGAGSAAAAAARSQPAQKPTKPVVAPLPAYDSDSESSFKKNKRRGSVSTVDSVGKYTMKRSMRSGSVDAGPPPPERGREVASPAKNGSGRFSLRSLSPTGSFMGRNQGEKIRQSLRGAPVDDTPTMRGKNNRASRDAKPQSGFSMSGFGKPKAAPAPAPKAKSGGFRSRFADSDDEDDAPRGAYRSRFADSDDEDSPVGPPKHMPANLAPVRGIPKRRGQDSDSTDLSDSEDEGRNGNKKTAGRASNKPGVPSQSDIDAAMAAARRNVAAMNGGREPGVPQPPPVPASNTTALGPEVPLTPTRRKGSFLGSVLRRNSSSFVAQSPVDSQHPRSPTTMRSPKQPKLQRRTTPQNWPLPAASTNGDASNDHRPTTSDGVPAMKKSMRPDNRRSMSGNDLKNMANGGTMQSATSGKKKKFSGLRKLFGLHD
jgi:serine/arginine repetitive matrix protein 2